MAKKTFWKQPLHQVRRLFAKQWLKLNPQVKIVAVTGSYGKTNITRAISQVLAEKYHVLQTDINLDTIYNLPLTILKLRTHHQVLVLELGVDQPREMDFHLDLVKPQIGVVTGITPVHSDAEHLGSLKNLIAEKGKLLQALPENGWAILNGDDLQVRKMARLTKARILWYGSDEKNCEWWIKKAKVNFSGTEMIVGNKKDKVKTRLIGVHFAHTVLAAAAIGDKLGLSWTQIKRGLAKLRPLKGRMNLERGPKGTMILNDALRANPASTVAGLETLAALPAKRKIAILGEMGELGNFAKRGHRQVGGKAAGLKIDYLLGVGPLHNYSVQVALKKGMKKSQVFWAKDVQEAAQILKKLIQPGDLLYLKGSLLRHLERVILLLQGKKVDCRLVVCDHYQLCPTCSDLRTSP